MKKYQEIKYAGADWLEVQGKKLSPFGRQVADILGQVEKGIYHISSTVLHKRTDWANPHYIQVVISGEWSSWDAAELVEVICLCHAQKITVGVTGSAPGYLKVIFRKASSLCLSEPPPLVPHIEAVWPLVVALPQSEEEVMA